MPESFCGYARADKGAALDKFGELRCNPNSGARYIFGHSLAPVKTVPGELSIVVHPLTALAHRQKEKTGRAVNSMTHHEAGSQDDKAKWK
jgi:hypothetical protein